MPLQIRDFRYPNRLITADIIKFLEKDLTRSIDILIYKANHDIQESVTDEVDVVGSIENRERELSYDDPISSRGMFLNFGFDTLPMDFGASGGVDAVTEDNPLVMVCQEEEVPEQSVIQFREYIDATNVDLVSLYIIKIEAVAQSPKIVNLFYLIPLNQMRINDITPVATEGGGGGA